MNDAIKVILLIAALFTAICGIGAKDQKMGWRCVALAAIFTAALAFCIGVLR